MKSLAFVALLAVPRPAIEFLGDRFHGWRKLFRACLVVIAAALLIVCALCALSPLFLCVFGGVN